MGKPVSLLFNGCNMSKRSIKFKYSMHSIREKKSFTVSFWTVVHSVQKWTVEHFLGFHVDGYAVVNGVETVWEYNGCKFHGCQCIKNPTNKQLEKQRKWIERKAHLEANGCHVIEMTDCRWRQKLRYIRRNPPKTEYGHILCFDNQECFIFWTSVHFEQNGQVFILVILGTIVHFVHS